jgi:hypothetical protein
MITSKSEIADNEEVANTRAAPNALLSANDRAFIETVLPAVTGWLLPGAAYYTNYLLRFQTAHKSTARC